MSSSNLYDERFSDHCYFATTSRTTTTNVPTSRSNMRTSSLMTPRVMRTSMSSGRDILFSQPLYLDDRDIPFSEHVYLDERFFNVLPYHSATKRTTSTRTTMLPRVEMVEQGEYVICLEEWSRGDMGTELPCKHKYHFECVEKWLRIHAMCPQCRYQMPLEREYVMENV